MGSGVTTHEPNSGLEKPSLVTAWEAWLQLAVTSQASWEAVRQSGSRPARPWAARVASQWRSQSPVQTFQLAARLGSEGLNSTRRMRELM